MSGNIMAAKPMTLILSDEEIKNSPFIKSGKFEEEILQGEKVPTFTDTMKWIFTKQEIENSPSIICGIKKNHEMLYRQQAVIFITKIGNAMGLNNLCIVTAIIAMQRFYMAHSFTHYHWAEICSAAILLATKLREAHYYTEYVTGTANYFLVLTEREHKVLHVDKVKQIQMQLLFTIGFDVKALDATSPPRIVLLLCRELGISSKIEETCYLLASCLVICTIFVLQYHPKAIACFSLYQTLKWTEWEDMSQSDYNDWYRKIDNTMEQHVLDKMITDFHDQYMRCHPKLKQKFTILSKFIHGDIRRVIKEKSSIHLFYPEFKKSVFTMDFELFIKAYEKKLKTHQPQSDSTTDKQQDMKTKKRVTFHLICINGTEDKNNQKIHVN